MDPDVTYVDFLDAQDADDAEVVSSLRTYIDETNARKCRLPTNLVVAPAVGKVESGICARPVYGIAPGLCVGATMVKQAIQFEFDTESVWNRVHSRHCVFLDTNAWIQMSAEVDESAGRVRDTLQATVAGGLVFCPVSWGTLEELFLQAGESLSRTATLMEELSLNACFVMRTEVYQWEFARSVGRCLGAPVDDSLRGLFTNPAAFTGTRPCVTFELPDHQILGPEAVANAQAEFQREMASIGIAELTKRMAVGLRIGETPPAYSEAAKKAKVTFKGNRNKLFVAEAENCFIMYIRPLLGPRLSPTTTDVLPTPWALKWLAQFAGPGGEEGWYRRALAQLPALHNFVDLIVEADTQPNRKDSNNHFMDNEIMTAPLAYADVFVSRDKGIRHLLQNHKEILARTKCHYCESLGELATWLASNVT